MIAEQRVSSGDARIDREVSVAIAFRADHGVAEDHDRGFDRSHVRVPGRPVACPVRRAGERTGAAHAVMGGGGALLQADELLRCAGLLPVDSVGVGNVDRCRHRHLRVLPGQPLNQLDVLEIERHAGVNMGIADLDHAGAPYARPSWTRPSSASFLAGPWRPASISSSTLVRIMRELYAWRHLKATNARVGGACR